MSPEFSIRTMRNKESGAKIFVADLKKIPYFNDETKEAILSEINRVKKVPVLFDTPVKFPQEIFKTIPLCLNHYFTLGRIDSLSVDEEGVVSGVFSYQKPEVPRDLLGRTDVSYDLFPIFLEDYDKVPRLEAIMVTEKL